jgi:hypothetical protein
VTFRNVPTNGHPYFFQSRYLLSGSEALPSHAPITSPTMTNKRNHGPAYQRKVYPLGPAHSSNPAKLDFRSHLALHWAERWIQQHGGLQVPHSGLIRRAVALYVRHLEKLDPNEAQHELQQVRSASAGTFTSRDDIEAAETRMEAAGDPLEPFEVILLGQYLVDERKAILARLQPLTDAVLAIDTDSFTAATNNPKTKGSTPT